MTPFLKRPVGLAGLIRHRGEPRAFCSAAYVIGRAALIALPLQIPFWVYAARRGAKAADSACRAPMLLWGALHRLPRNKQQPGAFHVSQAATKRRDVR